MYVCMYGVCMVYVFVYVWEHACVCLLVRASQKHIIQVETHRNHQAAPRNSIAITKGCPNLELFFSIIKIRVSIFFFKTPLSALHGGNDISFPRPFPRPFLNAADSATAQGKLEDHRQIAVSLDPKRPYKEKEDGRRAKAKTVKES